MSTVKSFDKIQHIIMIKNLKNRYTKNVYPVNNDNLQQTTANLIDKKLRFPFVVRHQKSISTFLLYFLQPGEFSQHK